MMSKSELLPEDADDLAALARSLIDANFYLTLASADGSGRPWATPVWFAHDHYTEFVWISRPDARHSLNIAARSEVGIVIFDSTVGVGEAKAIYAEADAGEVSADDRDRLLTAFSRRSERWGGGQVTGDEVVGPARHRLYRAAASAHFVLGPNDQRLPVYL
jgi:Pyridoxamine 5'-phosphate oxidase